MYSIAKAAKTTSADDYPCYNNKGQKVSFWFLVLSSRFSPCQHQIFLNSPAAVWLPGSASRLWNYHHSALLRRCPSRRIITNRLVISMAGHRSRLPKQSPASARSSICPPGKASFGLEINANHLRPKRDGRVTATGTPLHIGKSTQVWDVRIVDEQDRLICISRCTIAMVDLAQAMER